MTPKQFVEALFAREASHSALRTIGCGSTRARRGDN